MAMKLALVCLLLCCVVHAMDLREEENPIFVGPLELDCSRERCQEKMRTYLEAEGQVKVFYFSKEQEPYSATYDVRSRKIDVLFTVDKKAVHAVVPCLYAFHQEILKGYILKSGRRAPCITGRDFSDKDVDLKDYDLKRFFSQCLDNVLTKFFPELAAQDKVSFEDHEKELTADMLQTAVSTGKQFSWQVVQEDGAWKVWQQAPKNKPAVLLIVGGVGMLWGRLKRCTASKAVYIHGRSLFCYKCESTLASICAKHPFSKEERSKMH